jgi:hypothetical protein
VSKRSDLSEHYRDLSDTALDDAVRAGQTAYRAEAWQVIQREVERRGRSLVQPGRGQTQLVTRHRSLGMVVALLPAALVTGAIIVSVGPGRGGGMIGVAVIAGVATWFAAGVWIDRMMRRMTDRRDPEGSPR